ncbi:hypothetical protein FZ025_20125 [Xanthomonas hyacinthi]|uniref:Uncharacterized protein n=1 Tax=Xanthomonas hyacinthi TaxID=56455 RepID=A0A2S7EPN3_9XANT|nr:hypothetical protein XhyaCFBP1156_20005 [Xanthomonas hyacinthi]QGY78826.1 hypothetical protein FZ025_20125 [Xanthomonas hyacinthi]
MRKSGAFSVSPLSLGTSLTWRTWKRKEFVPRGMRAAQGELFSLEGCGHEAQGAAAPTPGFTTRQGRRGRPSRQGEMADSASPHDGCTGLRPDAGQVNAPMTERKRPCRSLGRRA